MIKVANGSCIRDLSKKSLRASKSRNIVAVCAIALTTILFTVLFTVLLSLNDAIQESNFRQVGGYAHGSFKYLTKEQTEELKGDSLIKEYGVRRVLGIAEGEPFLKTHVEVSWCDENRARFGYCEPEVGRLPAEGTNEAATDTKVLRLLGIQPELGATFTVTVSINGVNIPRTFSLCGWWESDEIAKANHILVPESTVEAVLAEAGVEEIRSGDQVGTWNLDVMLGSALHIQEDLYEILAKHGYTTKEIEEMSFGVNWGYTGAKVAGSIDAMTVLSIGVMLLLMMGTGYLIIYNVFQISVVGDIRFYGLLKTIGTTQKQIRHILRNQALVLSVMGIPVGLLLGWLLGAKLTPVVLGELEGLHTGTVSVHPFIFLFAAVFSLFTVLLSCRKPGRTAARISPVEALRYTEGNGGGKEKKKGRKGVSLLGMAMGNLARNKNKTMITVASLALSVVLLNVTVVFTRGFDMDLYLARLSKNDFMVADAAYFQSYPPFSAEQALSPEVVDAIKAQEGIEASATVYGHGNDNILEYMPEETFREMKELRQTPETVEWYVENAERSSDGRLGSSVRILGMEPYALDCMEVVEGDLSKLYEPGGNYVAATCHKDDFGNIQEEYHRVEVGDTVTIGYGEKLVDYEVAAVVYVPHVLSYRVYSSSHNYVMNAQTFCKESGTENIVYAIFDVTEEAEDTMEQFLKDYTEHTASVVDYESKAVMRGEFEEFRNMFFIVGSVLSFIVGMIGVLNFFNAILTGILARKREFAMLQSIGMTGGQLKTMLVCEGLMYAVGAAGCATVASVLLGPVTEKLLNSMFWFFTYKPTLIPVAVLTPLFLLLGAVVPMVMYRIVAKQTIVERLRESEN